MDTDKESPRVSFLILDDLDGVTELDTWQREQPLYSSLSSFAPAFALSVELSCFGFS